MTSWKDRQVDMSQYELDDDEPITEEQQYQDAVLRDVSRAQLVSRAAAAGMTPMEYMATGHASAAMPDDRLRYDESRQLPAPGPGPEEIRDVWTREILLQRPLEPANEPLLSTLRQEQIALHSTPVMRDGHFKDECPLCGGPCHQTELWEVASKKLGEQMEKLIASFDPSPRAEETEAVLYAQEADGSWKRVGRVTEVRMSGVQVQGDDIRARMEAWLAKDQGRSFREGFEGYFDRDRRGMLTPPTRAPEAVPHVPQEVIDAVPVEGEIMDEKANLYRLRLPEDDIIDAEVIEDETEES